MWFHPWANFFQFAFPRRRPPTRSASRARPFLEALEDRSVPSGVDPLPIPGGRFVPNPFGGPDGHFHPPGPADSATPDTIGGDPSTIYNFNGFVGVVRVDGTGTGTDNASNLWEVDLRFMDGVYQGVDGKIHHGALAEV